MREVLWEFVNEGDLGFLEGDWSKMGELWQLARMLVIVCWKNILRMGKVLCISQHPPKVPMYLDNKCDSSKSEVNCLQ